MNELIVAVTVFGVVFVGELPDKTAVASLVLGARYRPAPVLAGVATAFLLHVTVAVAAGGVIARLPRTPVELVTGALFVAGAIVLIRSNPDDALAEGESEAAAVTGDRGGWRIAVASFTLVLVAEFGDLTQILTATLAARYNAPVAVGIGALAALWTVAVLAVTFGRTLLRVIPLRRVQQLAAVILLALAGFSIASALA
jgi:putative Ca2+/H+ antiporter (TMEM165/GDT1 family)